MNNYLYWVGIALAVCCLITSIHLVIYGISRLQGRFMYSLAETLYFLLINPKRNGKNVDNIKQNMVKNRKWNLVIGISALASSPFMLLMAYLFYMLGKSK